MQQLNPIDWIVLIGTLLFIVLYGSWKTKGSKNAQDFIKGGNQSKWWTIGLSVMATQASAITFLSTTGQAYSDGEGGKGEKGGKGRKGKRRGAGGKGKRWARGIRTREGRKKGRKAGRQDAWMHGWLEGKNA